MNSRSPAQQPSSTGAQAPSPEDRADVILSISGAFKTFGSTQALSGANLAVRAGEVHGLVGANGAGKSTLVKAISGALKLDAGTIRLGEFEGAALSTREAHTEGLSTIYQDPSLVPTLGLAENILLGREKPIAGIILSKPRERREVASSLAKVGLKDRPFLLAGNLSASEQQLLEVATALHREARVVIMDEPTAAMGNIERDRLFEVIRTLRTHGVSVLYISHKLPEVLAICDRVTVMRDGSDVATLEAKSLDEDQLVRLMIGRELQRPDRETRKFGDIALKVTDLCQGERLQDISFNIRAGEIVGLTGLVGSGRTRLGRTLFGAEEFDSGSMELFGRPYRPADPHAAIAAGVGLVPQDRRNEALLMSMSVKDNITLSRFPLIYRFLVNVRAQRFSANRWIEFLRIMTTSASVLPAELSGGNQQKVSIARWLHAGARVMIFDEPGQAVDAGAKGEIFAAIRHLSADDCAVLVISDEIEELQQMVDRLLVMQEGRVTGELKGDEITDERVLELSMKTALLIDQRG